MLALHTRSKQSDQSLLDIRCRESTVLVTLLECFGRSLHTPPIRGVVVMGGGAQRRRRWSRAKLVETTLTKMSTSETRAIMWCCGAVLFDSNWSVLSHIYHVCMSWKMWRLFSEIVMHSFNIERPKWAQRDTLQSKATFLNVHYTSRQLLWWSTCPACTCPNNWAQLRLLPVAQSSLIAS